MHSTKTSAILKIPIYPLVLGLVGLLPFFVCALSQWMPLPFFGSSQGFQAGMFYGAVILSFLGGIRWGAAIGEPRGTRQNRDFAGSVVSSLLGWLSLLLSPVLGLSLLIAAFLLQGLWDVLSVEKGRLPQWFGKLRMVLTTGAVLSQLAMLVPLVFS